MALLTSFFIFLPISPAKTPTSNALFPRLRSPLSLSFSLTVKPIHTNNSTFITTRASLPHKYIYPDPCPHFAESETQKFKAELLEKLLKDKDEFGDELDAVIDVCAQGVIGDGRETLVETCVEFPSPCIRNHPGFMDAVPSLACFSHLSLPGIHYDEDTNLQSED